MNEIKELYLAGKTYREIGEELGINPKTIESRIRRSDFYKNRNITTFEGNLNNKSSIMVTKENIEIENINNSKDVIKQLGFNPEEWEIKTARFDEIDDKLYNVRINLTPRQNGLDLDDFLSKVENLKPLKFKATKEVKSNKNLVIPLFDLHFGNSALDDYKISLGKIKDTLKNKYNKVVVITGGDILNEDNYNGQTASGTIIGKTDMTNAWLDCFTFVSEILTSAIENSNEVELVYVPGNHDTFSGHTVLLGLSKLFRESKVKFDLEQQVYKALLLDKVFIGCTHGHRANVKRYPMIMATTFPKLWGEATIRECFTGHLHNEWSSKDSDGIMIRQMPSRNEADEWHREMGFTASHKRFILAEYGSEEINALYFV